MKKILSITLLALILLLLSCAALADQQDGYIIKKTVVTTDAEYKYVASDDEKEISVDDVKYELKNIKLNVVAEKNVTEPQKVTTTVVVKDLLEKEYAAQETLSKDEITYSLTSVTYDERSITENVIKTVSYQKYMSTPDAPDTINAEYTFVQNEVAKGQTVEVEYVLTNNVKGKDFYIGYSNICVIIEDYDAPTWKIAGYTVNNSQELPFKEADPKFLEALLTYVKMPTACRIIGAEWDGEAYTDGDVIKRNGRYLTQAKVADYEYTYEGVATIPVYDATANYEGTIEVDTGVVEKTVEVILEYEKIPMPIVPVAVGGGTVFIVGIFLIWFFAAKPVKVYAQGKIVKRLSVKNGSININGKHAKDADFVIISKNYCKRNFDLVIKIYRSGELDTSITIQPVNEDQSFGI